MKSKVILISIDGMRPDGLFASGNPYREELERIAAYPYRGGRGPSLPPRLYSVGVIPIERRK